MNQRRSFAVLAIALAGALATSQALAGGPSPSAADRATARALSAEGHKAMEAKDYATAANRFARADALVHAPTLMLNLARAQAALGKLVAANESYARIIREDLPSDSPKVWFEAKETAAREAPLLAPRMCWVTVTVGGAKGQEDYLKVTLDGVDVPAAAIGAKRPVDPGRHVAVATVTGGDKVGRAEATVTLGEGKALIVPLKLVLKAAPPGTPRLVLKAKPVSRTQKLAGFVSIGVGGAALLMGAATGSAVIAMHGSLNKACTGGVCPTSQESKLSTYNALGLASTIGFISGAAIGGLGVVLVAIAPKQQTPKVGFSVVPSAGGGMLSAAGSF